MRLNKPRFHLFISAVAVLFLLLLLSSAYLFRGLLGAVYFEKDIRYGQAGGFPLHLDLAQPRFGRGPYPALLIMHGGGWSKGDKTDMDFLAKMIASRGYVAMSVQYRLSPDYIFPAAVHDVKCAVRWVRAHAEKLQVDPQRIGVLGGSAGAHLALMLGTTQVEDGLEGSGCNDGYSSEVQAVVNLVGPADLTLKGISHFVKVFVGGPENQLLEKARRASPITYVDAKDPPVLTVHGDSDTVVDYQHALLLQKTLQKAGVKNRLFTAKGADHGWLGLRNGIGAQLAMNRFLDDNLMP